MNNSAMYKISYGLYVLTAREDGRDNGCIINTLEQVTTSPNRVSIAVNKQNYTHDMIRQTGVFNASVLSGDAGFEVFKHFGFQSGRDTEKFVKDAPLPRAKNGLIYIPEITVAYISGRVWQEIDLGTHTMFIADVEDCDVTGTGAPMTYAYYHANVKPKPQKTEKKGFRCKICGYVYEGDELPPDFVCPICKHGAADFERIE